MVRIKSGPQTRRRHKKTLQKTKGYQGTRHRLFKRAHEAELRSGKYAYAGRRLRRRDMRRLWIQRINAALSEYDISFSKFMKLLKDANIELDRKILAQLAVENPEMFKRVVEKAVSKGGGSSRGEDKGEKQAG